MFGCRRSSRASILAVLHRTCHSASMQSASAPDAGCHSRGFHRHGLCRRGSCYLAVDFPAKSRVYIGEAGARCVSPRDGSVIREVSNITMPAAPSGDRESRPVWDFMRVGPARRAAWIAAFAALYAILVVLGLMLRENSQQLVIIWPAAGLLFMALWFSPRRSWIWILGVQMAVEFSINLVRSTHFPWLHLQYHPRQLARRRRGRAHRPATDRDPANSPHQTCRAIPRRGCARLRGKRGGRRL